jgi:hypothetical protein
MKLCFLILCLKESSKTLIKVVLIKSFLLFYYNPGCLGQRSVYTRILTNSKEHATPY